MPIPSDSLPESAASHLDSWTIAALADGHLDPAERGKVEQHLAACAQCRAETYEVRRLLRTLPKRRMVPIRWAAAAVIAAGLALAVLLPSEPGRTTPETQAPERSAASMSRRTLAVRQPEGASTSRARLRFVWENAGHGNRYQLTVVDSTGGALWRTETMDTVVVPPAGISLPLGVALFWYVDALGPDARTITTRAIALRLTP